jgi:hypothetical protein
MPPPISTWSAIFQQVADHADLIADLGPAQDGDEGPRGRQLPAQVLDFLFHQEACHSRQEAGHAFGRGVRPVGRAKGIVDVDIRHRSQLLRQVQVVLGLTRFKPGVLQQQHFARLQPGRRPRPSGPPALPRTSPVVPSSSLSRSATGRRNTWDRARLWAAPGATSDHGRARSRAGTAIVGSAARMRVSSPT